MYRSAAGKCDVCGAFGGDRWSRSETAERRPSIKVTQTSITSIVSPDFGVCATREEELRVLREAGCTGRPLGSATFVEHLEATVGRVLKPQKGGRPSKLRKPP